MTVFTPTPFPSPTLPPNIVSAFQPVSYLSPSWYRFAPTAVGTKTVPGSQNAQLDSLSSLAEVISQASAWMDEFCFHQNDASFALSVFTEQMRVKPKFGGEVQVICNVRPVRAVIGVGLGPMPTELLNIGSPASQAIIVGDQTITIPGAWANGVSVPWFGGWPTLNGQLLVVYSYAAGYPHATLSANAAKGATSIQVTPAFPSGIVQAGARLRIEDASVEGGPVRAETVTLTAAATSGTLSVSALQYAHNLPASPTPDSIQVTAIPTELQRACIYLVNVIEKTQGTGATVLPGAVGAPTGPQRQALGRAGVLNDFDHACRILHKYKTPFRHT